jgi:hypothetical protein
VRYVFIKPKSTDFDRIQGVLSSRRGYFEIHHQFFIFEIKKYENSYKYAWQFKAILS